MFDIDFSEWAKTALSAAGAVLLTAGALAAAAGPAEFGRTAPASYAQAADGARA